MKKNVLNKKIIFQIHSQKRFVRGVSILVLNSVIAGVLIYQKVVNPSKHISSAILSILGFNLFLYLAIFIYFKNCHRLCCRENGLFSERFIATGVLFTFLSMACGVLAVYFYVQGVTDRNASPAESRNQNGECLWLNFYDSHDFWHLFSAAAAFMGFLGLLTVDDDLLDTPIDRISVY